jgi:hypothetical protein
MYLVDNTLFLYRYLVYSRPYQSQNISHRCELSPNLQGRNGQRRRSCFLHDLTVHEDLQCYSDVNSAST